VKQERPRQHQRDQLDDDAGQEALEHLEAQFRSQALVEEVKQERKEDEQQPAADAVENRHAPRQGKTVCRQYLPDTDVPEFRPRFFQSVSHKKTPFGISEETITGATRPAFSS